MADPTDPKDDDDKGYTELRGGPASGEGDAYEVAEDIGNFASAPGLSKLDLVIDVYVAGHRDAADGESLHIQVPAEVAREGGEAVLEWLRDNLALGYDDFEDLGFSYEIPGWTAYEDE